MLPYQYRFDISDDVEFQRSPLIRAAFALAKKAHAPHLRGKKPDVPYLCHPIMAYDLLRGQGISDPAMLAAALLHDTGEMCERYQDSIPQLEADLVQKMEYLGETGDAARNAAKEVARLVEEVTNPEKAQWQESKLMVQIRRVKGMSQRGKIIKIADQTASLICHLMEPNADRISHDKTYLFARKADGLVKEITRSCTNGERYEIQSWRKLFDNVYDMNKVLLAAKSPQAQANVRESYKKQLSKVMRFIDHTMPVETPDEPIVRHIRCSKRFADAADYEANEGNVFGLPQFGGVCDVEFDQQGDVTGFTIWAEPTGRVDHYRNRMQSAITDYLQLHGYDLSVDTDLRPVMLEHALQPLMHGRHHCFAQPVPARHFAELVEKADGIGRADALNIARCAHDLTMDYDMPETGGAVRPDLSRRGDAAAR